MNAIKVIIAPKQIFPQADVLVVQPGAGIPPAINYLLGKLVPGSSAVSQVGVPGHTGYVPAIPEVPDQIIQHTSGTLQMTDAQWKAWTTQDDEEYLKKCAVELLDVKLI